MDQEVDVWKPDAAQLFGAVSPTTPGPDVVALLPLPPFPSKHPSISQAPKGT